ncbi:MAG: hypothetical protein AB7S75_11360 [Desulfococcaceae bacterium]
MKRNANFMRMFFCALCLLMFPLYANATSVADSCTLFNEDFSGLSAHSWDYEAMQIQNEKLSFSRPGDSTVGIASVNFIPSGPFSVDVDVQADMQDTDAGFGISPFTNGDLLLNVNGMTADGVSVFVFPGLSTMFFGAWDVINGRWWISDPYTLNTPVNTIGLKYGETGITIRINKSDTDATLSGDFALAGSVINTLWIMAYGPNSAFAFDNVCADPVSSGIPEVTEATLTDNLDLILPMIQIDNLFLRASFQYVPDPAAILFRLTDYAVIDNPGYQNPAILSSALDLYIPSLKINGTPYWINLFYDPSRGTGNEIYFQLKNFGVAEGASAESFTASGTARTDSSVSVQTASGAAVFVPMGAVAPGLDGQVGTTVFSIERDNSLTPVLPEGEKRISDVYRFGPSGFNFQQAVTVTIPLTGAETVENAVLYRMNETTGEIEMLGGVFDAAARTVTGQTTHFSPIFAASAPLRDSAAGCILLDNSGASQYTWRNVCPSEILEFYFPGAAPFEGAASVSPDSCTSGWCNQIRYIVPQGRYRLCVETWTKQFQSDLPRLTGHTILPEIVDVHVPYRYPDYQISKTVALGNLTMNQPGPCPCSSTPTSSVGTGDLGITLIWHSSVPVDLDLWVTEPNGNVIDYGSPTSSTGGTLDIDNQCDDYVAGRAENIFWTNPPAGNYKVEVNWYDLCSDTSLNSVSYEVRVVNKGETKTYTGTIAKDATVNVVTVNVQ